MCDLVRDLFVAEHMEAIAQVVRRLRTSRDLELVRVKDRFATPSAGGWRDVMINYRLASDPRKHICEVQICHRCLLMARQHLPGHQVYGRVRNAAELLERLALLDQSTHRLCSLRAAVEGLERLEAPQLAQHREALALMLNDSQVEVRKRAAAQLGRLDAELLAEHAAALVATLEDTKAPVRNAAADALGKLTSEALTPHVAGIAAKLKHPEWGVRFAAAEALGKADPEALAQHAHVIGIVAKEDDKEFVRRAAQRLLSKNQEPRLPFKNAARTVTAFVGLNRRNSRERAYQT